MKTIKYASYLLLALILIITSCNKNLDTQPTDQIAEADVFTTIGNARAALNGI